MPDLGPFIGAVGELVAPALGAFLRTFVGMIVLGLLASVGSIALAWERSALRGLLAGVIAIGVFIGLGLVLAVKRAIARAILRGLADKQLGRRALAAIFDQMADTSVGKLARSVPLADAERLLADAVRSILKGGADGGWLRKKLQRGALEKVSAITLARFRSEGGAGIDLDVVRDQLGDKIDAMLLAKTEGAIKSVTMMLVLLAIVISVGAAFALRSA